MSEAYPPGTTEGDVERAFGDGEPTMRRLWPESGRPWVSPSDADWEFGDPAARYVVALVQGDGVPREVARRSTLEAARLRRDLIARRFDRRAAVVVWDSEDYERGDLSTSGDAERER